MVSAAETRARLQVFAEWARKRRLTPARHDAEFHGMLADTAVHVETGIRDSALYTVRLTLARGCALDRRADASALAHASPQVLSIRFDAVTTTLRLRAGTAPEVVDDLLDTILTLLREPRCEAGPYR